MYYVVCIVDRTRQSVFCRLASISLCLEVGTLIRFAFAQASNGNLVQQSELTLNLIREGVRGGGVNKVEIIPHFLITSMPIDNN